MPRANVEPGQDAFDADPKLENLLLAPYFREATAKARQASVRELLGKTLLRLAERKELSLAGMVFIGDCTLGEGVVYEALNMASLWNAPLLVVLENNHIAQTTPTALALAGSIADRFKAFGLAVNELDSSDVMQILPLAERVLTEVRAENRPQALILNTARFGPHSKGDDSRSKTELEQLKATRDPLKISAAHLSEAEMAPIRAEVEEEVHAAFTQALADPFPAEEAVR